MGCDIHCGIEAKQKDGSWKFLSPTTTEDGVFGLDWKQAPYDSRNYELFAFLADVRQEYDEEDHPLIEPICPPKGVPDDASEVWKQIVKQWGADGHSHTHFTLMELLEAPWAQMCTDKFVVDAVNYNRWKKFGTPKPQSYCGSVGGKDIVVHDSDQSAEWVGIQNALDDDLRSGMRWEQVSVKYNSSYVRSQSHTPVYQIAGEFWSNTIPQMLAAAKVNNVEWEDIRLVMFFDN